MCDKVVSKKSIIPKYCKTDIRLKKCVIKLLMLDDWLVTRKMLEILDNVVSFNDDIDPNYINFDIVIFFVIWTLIL